MSSFDILSPKTSLWGNLFLEASAGTGKTFTIEHLVIRLLLEGALTLRQILVVTFTRAATRELKVRIQANLESIVYAKEGQKWEYLQNCTEEQMDRLRLALTTFDEAQIFTIHGFCQKILQEFAFEAGWSFQVEPWEPGEEREALLLFLQKILKGSGTQWFLLLKSFQFDIESLGAAVLKTQPPKEAPQVFSSFLAEFKEILEEISPFPLLEQFQSVAENYKGIKEEDFTQAKVLEDIFREKKVEAFETLLLSQPSFLEKLDASNLKVRAKVRTLPEMLSLVVKKLKSLLMEASDETLLLQTLSLMWQEEKKRLFKEKGKVLPDDFLKGVEEALQEPSFIKAVQKKYGAAIIDEFQDTDAIQWKIFETLFFHPEMRAFYLVGDYKQSIYAFRSADVYTFLKASERFSQKFSLSTNYRSEKGLLDKLNHLFCQRPWMDLPAWNQTLPVPAVNAHKGGEGTLHFFIAKAERGRSRLFPTVAMEEDYFFPFIIQEIQDQALKVSQVAILVKDRFQAKRVHAFLQKWGYPGSIQRGGSLAESLSLLALEEVFEAVLEGSLSSVKKVAFGPFIQKTTSCPNEFFLYAKEVFLRLRQTLQDRGIAAFFGLFLEEDFGEGVTVLQRMISLPDLTFYEDTQEVMDLLLQKGDSCRLLEGIEEIRRVEVSDRVRGQGEGMQIMTVHASKGLEFDTVFALAVASRGIKSKGEEEEAEKLRQLYVALTRAKTRLYIPVALEEGTKDEDNLSPLELFCKKVEPDFSHYEVTHLNEKRPSCSPYTFKATETLQRPKAYLYQKSPLFLSSFSALSSPQDHFVKVADSTIPSGSEVGVVIHRIFERLWKERGDRKRLIQEEIAHTVLEPHFESVLNWIEKTLELPLEGFCLNDVLPSKARVEMEFVFPKENQMIKGFIDLWFEHEGKYYLVDWKTNVLEDYTPKALQLAMERGDYFLQASLYSEALERHLKRFERRSFKECFGGAIYIFVRGPAAFRFKA